MPPNHRFSLKRTMIRCRITVSCRMEDIHLSSYKTRVIDASIAHRLVLFCKGKLRSFLIFQAQHGKIVKLLRSSHKGIHGSENLRKQ